MRVVYGSGFRFSVLGLVNMKVVQGLGFRVSEYESGLGFRV